MELEVVNVGPVRSASIALRPLTIFVGPNNSGKSIIGTVLYSVLSAKQLRHNPMVGSVRADRELLGTDGIEQAFGHYFDLRASGVEIPFAKLDRDLRSLISYRIERIFEGYESAVDDELERTTGTTLRGLRRVQKNATRATIGLRSTGPEWSLEKVITAGGVKTDVDLPDPDEVWSAMQRRKLRRPPRYYSSLPPGQLSRELNYEVNRACFQDFPVRTKYLPAARSGLMQSHKILAGTLIRWSSLAGLEDLRIPTMSGIVTDFLSELIEIEPNYKSSFFKMGQELESGILHGSVDVDMESSGYPELIYRTAAGDFPLTRTSSMVSELAPIVIYLKQILTTRDLLFIEEPEAHLHPTSQVLLAKVIAALVNAGLQIGLTTHSEFFLQQLNNSIVAGDLPEQRVRETNFEPDLRLSPDLVAAYKFTPGLKGTSVEKISAAGREGITESGFDSVAEMLYNQTVELDRKFDD